LVAAWLLIFQTSYSFQFGQRGRLTRRLCGEIHAEKSSARARLHRVIPDAFRAGGSSLIHHQPPMAGTVIGNIDTVTPVTSKPAERAARPSCLVILS
jgi:hypothetical protein